MHPLTRALPVIWWLLLVGQAQAIPIVDQEHAPPGNFPALAVANDRTQIQTFTVGVTGVLTRIDVQVRRSPQTVEDLVLSLWSTDVEGLPENLLATVSLPASATTQDIPAPFVPFDLGAASVAVSAGDVLAIELDSNAANVPPFFQERYEWEFGGQYGGGTAYTRIGPVLLELGEDFHFRTYVDTGILPVALDTKPRSFPNAINPNSNGVIPVAILTTDAFDATTVDPLSVEFGPHSSRRSPRRQEPEGEDTAPRTSGKRAGHHVAGACES
jgi:hypothetical protein